MNANTTAGENSPISEGRLAVLAGLLVVVGSMSVALYTPALPQMSRELGSTTSVMQMSVAVYLFGFTACQLVCGPLSDRYGRRPILLIFSAIYVLGSLVIVWGQSVESLMLGRIIQGIGACAGPALGRAMVRDCYQGDAGARLLAVVAMVLSLGPCLAPSIGALLLIEFGWQSIFVAMASYGIGMVLLVLFVTPETNQTPNMQALAISGMLKNYRAIAVNRTFLRMTLAVSCSLGIIFTFPAFMPFILIDQIGLSPGGFALAVGTTALFFFLGSAAASRLIKRVGAVRLIWIGLVLVAISGLSMSFSILALTPSVASIIGPAVLWSFGTALVLPGGTNGALAPFGRIAGSASALHGFAQMVFGVLGTCLVALFSHVSTAYGIVPLCFAMIGLFGFIALQERRRTG